MLLKYFGVKIHFTVFNLDPAHHNIMHPESGVTGNISPSCVMYVYFVNS